MRLKNIRFLPLLVLLCGCNRSPVPRQWRHDILKITVHSVEPSASGPFNGWYNLKARDLRVEQGALTGIAGMPDAQKHSVGVWGDITAISPEGVQILMHTGRNMGMEEITRSEQSVLVPYDKPVSVTLAPDLLFEARFEKDN